MEPAEPAVMKGRFEATADEYERLFGRLAGHMAAEWQRLDALAHPDAGRRRTGPVRDPARTAAAATPTEWSPTC
ncbi:hypothetical protein [Streptomyces sp. NPDC059262]|uniref:hypothetical protein n=1 Tax=Streptomyces sp. NPDC059262 TaxID=3346797 RepID=UPI0036C9C978